MTRLLFVAVLASVIFAKQVMTWAEWFGMLIWLNFWIALAWMAIYAVQKLFDWWDNSKWTRRP